MPQASARVVLFASAREAAGCAAVDVDAGRSLAEILDDLSDRFGPQFRAVLATSRVWCNGDDPPNGYQTEIGDGDEVAVLPPVSGGS